MSVYSALKLRYIYRFILNTDFLYHTVQWHHQPWLKLQLQLEVFRSWQIMVVLITCKPKIPKKLGSVLDKKWCQGLRYLVHICGCIALQFGLQNQPAVYNFWDDVQKWDTVVLHILLLYEVIILGLPGLILNLLQCRPTLTQQICRYPVAYSNKLCHFKIVLTHYFQWFLNVIWNLRNIWLKIDTCV